MAIYYMDPNHVNPTILYCMEITYKFHCAIINLSYVYSHFMEQEAVVAAELKLNVISS